MNQNDFFTSLGEGVANLMSTVLKDDSRHLFRRSPQVRLGDGANGEDFSVSMTTREFSERENGTFTVAMGGDRFRVYREPAMLTVGFALQSKGASANTKLSALDKLHAYFFDTKSVDPILPESIKEQPALYERMKGKKAEIRIAEKHLSESDPLSFHFTYKGLYHSGNPLREETKIRQRVINYRKNEQERSL